MEAVNTPSLEFSAALSAPVEDVFAALTDAARLQRWFCDSCESEPRVNGRLVMRWTRAGSSSEPFEARWVEFAPPARAAFQGGHVGYPGGNAGTVWYALEPHDDGTRLRITHTLPASAGYEAMLAAWRGAWPRALERLARHLATAERGA